MRITIKSHFHWRRIHVVVSGGTRETPHLWWVLYRRTPTFVRPYVILCRRLWLTSSIYHASNHAPRWLSVGGTIKNNIKLKTVDFFVNLYFRRRELKFCFVLFYFCLKSTMTHHFSGVWCTPCPLLPHMPHLIFWCRRWSSSFALEKSYMYFKPNSRVLSPCLSSLESHSRVSINLHVNFPAIQLLRIHTSILHSKIHMFITLWAPYQTDFGTNTEIQYFFRICRLRHTQIWHVFRHFLFVKGW